MRKRSVRVQYIFFGGIVLFFVLAFFTMALVPFEEFLLRMASSAIFGYGRIAGGAGTSSLAGADANLVHVITKRSDEFQDVFLVNKSVSVGTKVLSGDTLVGFVVLQGAHSSKVQSITSPFFKINGVISRVGIPIELQGKGAQLLGGCLPRGSDVQKGDVVFHSEGDALSIGIVAQIIDIASDPFLEIIVLSSVNLTTISDVQFLLQ
jgi:hypothetical protein